MTGCCGVIERPKDKYLLRARQKSAIEDMMFACHPPAKSLQELPFPWLPSESGGAGQKMLPNPELLRRPV